MVYRAKKWPLPIGYIILKAHAAVFVVYYATNAQKLFLDVQLILDFENRFSASHASIISSMIIGVIRNTLYTTRQTYVNLRGVGRAAWSRSRARAEWCRRKPPVRRLAALGRVLYGLQSCSLQVELWRGWALPGEFVRSRLLREAFRWTVWEHVPETYWTQWSCSSEVRDGLSCWQTDEVCGNAEFQRRSTALSGVVLPVEYVFVPESGVFAVRSVRAEDYERYGRCRHKSIYRRDAQKGKVINEKSSPGGWIFICLSK